MSIKTHKINRNSSKQSSFFKMTNKSNYLYNVYKSSYFKSIATLFPNYINNDFKHLLNKLYLEFKEHEPIISKINIENTRVNLPIERATNKINHILKNTFSDTQYIDNTIVAYINNNINKCRVFSYENTINEQTFIFNFIIYDKINIKKLDSCVKAMLLILQVIINISNNKKGPPNNNTNICNINGLQLNIFMTHFVKEFELYTNKVLGAININSGLTYPCSKTGEIYIYRKHEFFKVFIHETLHSYNIDKLLRNNLDSNSYYQTLIKTFNIASTANSYNKIGLNEAITEFWTFIIHSFVYCYYNSTNFEKTVVLFERCYKYEATHSSFQVAKILYANKLSYDQFLTTITNNGTTLYNETSHILSYIFFKSLLIYNVEKVIKSNMFNFKIQTLDLFKLDITMSANNSLDDFFIMLRNYSLNNNTQTIIKRSYNIYKKYISLLKSQKKFTVKKSYLLNNNTVKHLLKNKSHKQHTFTHLGNINNYLLTNLSFMAIDYSL